MPPVAGEKTEFHVVVVQIGEVTKHPNADTLSLTTVEGNPCIFKTGEYQPGDNAVYVPVDAVVPTDHPAFAFLASGDKLTSRIKARRLRGIFSMGLLVPMSALPDGLTVDVGDDVADFLGITKYQTPEERRLAGLEARISNGKNAKKAGGLKLPVYGLDPLRKYEHVLQQGEQVSITEKIHGTNARFCYHKGRLWVGSHKVMRGASRHRFLEVLNKLRFKVMDLLGVPHRADVLRDAGDVWWETAEAYGLKEKLARFPDHVLYGEIYGESVQDLTYDSPKGRRFRAFDVYDLKAGKFLDYRQFRDFVFEIGLSRITDVVPELRVVEWTAETAEWAKQLANTGKSTLNPDQLIEGVVIKPVVERQDSHCGRVGLKFVGEGYLLRGDEKKVIKGSKVKVTYNGNEILGAFQLTQEDLKPKTETT
jgi:RNA ligase (TIGR02306 family)